MNSTSETATHDERAQTFSSLVLDRNQFKTKRSKRSAGKWGESFRSAAAEAFGTTQKLYSPDELPVSTTQEVHSPDELRQLIESLSRDNHESKYHIIEDVARGGMGSIYSVFDKDIRRKSVLKVILPNYKDNPDMIKRFMFEARITGLLEHPNIVSMHDIGFLDNLGIYFTMTYVHGESLRDIIDKLKADVGDYRQKYDLFGLLNIFRKVCDAIAYAHSRNIIHRDVKPENIMVGQFGEVIVMDWGLAKKLDDSDDEYADLPIEETLSPAVASPSSTSIGSIKGTPVYLSPEQVTGDPGDVDKLSDIFLLGATLYHMFTYRAPYTGSKLKHVLNQAGQSDFTPPEKFMKDNDQLTIELCTIINKAMKFNKADRYPSAEAMMADIDDLLRGKMVCNTKVFAIGEKLLEEGDVGHTCFFIVHGKVDIYKTVEGARIPLATVSNGDLVGEMALITHAPRTASAVAVEETRTIVLSKEIFTHNLKKLPIWMEKIMTVLAERLEIANQKLSQRLARDQ